MRRIGLFLIILIAVIVIAACGGRGSAGNVTQDINETTYVNENPGYEETAKILTDGLSPSSGRIFLFGEVHGIPEIMDRQLEIWGDFYHNYGMRHLFIEASYFTAQFLNIWMQADDDTILYQLFYDWRGSPAHNPHKLVFYRTIKNYFPETVFHGTDVGHQSASTGQRFIRHLTDNNLQDTESYRLTRESIAQFNHFNREGSHAVRAYYKPRNFIREFDRLGNQDVMAIHGGAHIASEYFLGYTGVPSMATVLRERYGDALQIVDMSHYASPRSEPYRVDIISVGGIDFEASYFGIDRHSFTTGDGREIIGREFWRLENAYEYFRDNPLTGNVLPFHNFPMYVEVGQVFIMDIHLADGTVDRGYYRASGHYWNNLRSTQEFTP